VAVQFGKHWGGEVQVGRNLNGRNTG
jgi:hypothetical protein